MIFDDGVDQRDIIRSQVEHERGEIMTVMTLTTNQNCYMYNSTENHGCITIQAYIYAVCFV